MNPTRPLVHVALVLVGLMALDAHACTTRSVQVRYRAHETALAGASEPVRLQPRPGERWFSVNLQDDSRVPARFWVGQDTDGNGTPDDVRLYCRSTPRIALDPGGGAVVVRIAWEQHASLPGCEVVLAVGGVATFQLGR